jgi:hypothetical protein
VTLAQALDYLRNRHNETDASTSYWGDVELYALISARAQTACAVLGLIEDTDSSTATVASTQNYDWPSDASAIRKVTCDGKPLQEMTFREWDENKLNGTTPEGEPFGYVNFNRQIILVPIPNDVYDLVFYYEPYHPWITVPAGTIDLPAVLHPALMDGVMADMFAKANNAQMATMYENKWTGHMQSTFPIHKLRESQRARAKILVDGDTAPSSQHGVK